MPVKPTIQEFGYNPIWMKTLIHTEDINNKIIAEIRRSKFMIADFTGLRGGVYFEAGYARALGIKVIHTCQDMAQYRDKLHFDTNHINHLFWKDEINLKKQLADWIEVAIGRAG